MISQQIQELLLRLVEQQDEHAVIVLDRTGRIIAWLGAAEKIFGYEEKEVIGQLADILFTPEDRVRKMAEYEIEVAASDGHAEDDRWMQRNDDRRFWATGILAPIRSEAGEVLGFGKILRNRTDIKGQLESGQKLIERLQLTNESKNVFIATLAHELRNPLAAIRNSLTILELVGSKDHESRFAQATAQRQLDHMHRMIEDLLEVAKADVGKLRIDKVLTSLKKVLDAAVETCRPAIDKVSQRLEMFVTETPIMIFGDPDRLEQIFVNLIQNASKYTTNEGSIWVKASIEGNEAVVRVEDTGVGISPEMLPRIFDLFTQADDNRQEGLGIGLSLVKDLTALHGGTVQVRSDGLNKGSEFAVRLPLASAEVNATAVQDEP